ncbi:uncharacterized protein FIBRA_03698 [Fibroporia radiculosa]|uniref:Mitochondrial import inner membrane translocase subunit Tim21 n=1 Tax=Fibroporia radiculosa TaxID=599839 RepID=J4HW48_9APHY|nr:uncharacterized protein FIBRA_03698 [Fibroporia radiculosa]CCM01637.1 predicted protein [Fibroporia radiculosa]
MSAGMVDLASRLSLAHRLIHASIALKCRRPAQAVIFRSYATVPNERASPSSLLSNALDQRRRTAQRDDYVGPFQLGLIPPVSRGGENVKKWSELSAAGKVARTTARTTNLAVILFGAGLSGVLIYALTSELFSKNSATVLYGQACEKIKASPKLAKFLQGPLVFHNNPPSLIRPRHRNHHVSSQLVVDAAGREHMLLHFYVQGRPPGSLAPLPDTGSISYVDSAIQWAKTTTLEVSEMSLDDLIESTKTRADVAWSSAKELFRFLTGDPLPSIQLPEPSKPAVKVEQDKKGWMSSFTGLFSGLKGPARSASESGHEGSDGKNYSEGEVHVDLVMNDHGYFEFRYLFVDIPNTQSWNSRRVIIDRSEGVRDNEPVLSWRSS